MNRPSKHSISLSLFCLTAILLMNNLSYAQAYKVSHIDSSLLVGANSVMRNDQTLIEVKSNKFILDRSYAVTLLDDSANDLLQISLGYKKGSSKILDFKVVLYNAEGGILGILDEKSLEDYSGYDGYSIITDYRTKYMKLNEMTYPFTIEVSFTLDSRNTFLIPAWYPAWKSKMSIENASVQLINRTDTEIRFNEKNLKEFEIEKSENLNYVATNIQAFNIEEYSPHPYSIMPRVEFRPTDFTFEKVDGHISDWESYGQFYQTKLMASQNTMDGREVHNELKKYVDLNVSKREIVGQVYKYIQDNTRYVSIALDEGGFQPMSTAEVHVNKYGDCKALSFYMISILKGYNIKANYVEVYAGKNKPLSLDPTFASPAPGNHIIVNVPLEKDTIWLDCTSSTNPVDYLGSFTDDRYAVEVSESEGKIVKTPSYNEISFVKEKAKAVLDEEGNISLSVDCENSGYYIDDKLRYQKYDESEMKKIIEEKRYAHFHKTDYISYSQKIQPEKLLVSEKIKVNAESYAELVGNYYMLPLLLSPSALPVMVSKKERRFPIEFFRKILEIRSYEFEVPEGFLLEEKQKSGVIESKYGKYKYKIEQNENGVILLDSDLEIYKGFYDPSEFDEIKTFLASIKKQQNVQLILKK